MRKKAIPDRRDRTYKRTKVESEILDEIAKALKMTSQVAGKTSGSQVLNDKIYSRPGSRCTHSRRALFQKMKRKLKAICNEDTLLINPEHGQHLEQENADLKARLAHAEGQLALMVNGSAQLSGLIQKFNI